MINRRNLIQYTLASIPLISYGIPSFAKNTDILEKIVQSFPNIPMIKSDNPLHLAFFIHMDKVDNGQIGLRCSSAVVDCTKAYNTETFLNENFTEMTFDRPRHNVSAVVSGANKVAKQTRRGRGNNYAVLSDHILVWYTSKTGNPYDTPIQKAGLNLAYNPNFKDYFVRVRGFELSDRDHEILSENGFNRIS